ncbi:AI-2E family transporter [Conexibacter woesei]|uniref:AI-2E family transporter n=1 Tax=Conexibacter woesei TaxID=191495 RepID=UPI00047EEDD5|nr:AI-2E family transporter [Conexibacter woesei]
MSARTVLGVLALCALVALVLVSLGTLLSIFVAGIVALGLDPPVTRLVARGWRRGVAALTVFVGIFIAAVVLVLLTAGPLWDQIVEFVNTLPAYWDKLTHTDGFQQWIGTAGADDQIKEGLKNLAAGLPDAATTILGIAGGVFGGVLSLVTLTFLALFLLMERPTITDWLFGFATPPVEQRWRPVVEESVGAISSSLLGNLAISVVAATVAGLSAWAFGLPFPIVLAVMTGFLDLIPQVGATIAAVVLVAIGLTVSTTAGVAMLVIQLIYQQLENYVVYPIVYRRAVELSAFTTIVAVLIASSILGVVGAILAVPFAAVIKILLREAGRPRREQMAALREQSERAPPAPTATPEPAPPALAEVRPSPARPS